MDANLLCSFSLAALFLVWCSFRSARLRCLKIILDNTHMSKGSLYMITSSLTRLPSHKQEGKGVFNSLLNKIPFELHYSGYNYLGPGTKLEQRLKRGDKGINPLDEAAKNHNISYAKYPDTEHRHIADKILQRKAWERVVSKDATLGERSAALLTASAMKVKRILGMGFEGCRGRKKRCKRGKGLRKPTKTRRRKKKKKQHQQRGQGVTFGSLVRKARASIKAKKPDNLTDAVNVAVGVVRPTSKKITRVPRIIPIPKTGGALPLIPILAGISALSGAVSGVHNIVKTVGEILAARKEKREQPKKIGTGLYLAPNTKGDMVSSFNRIQTTIR